MSGVTVYRDGAFIELTSEQWHAELAGERAQWDAAASHAREIVTGLSGEEKWALRQELASPGRYYGDGGTIHSSTDLDVETRDGRVVAVWFRCLMLPFEQTEVDYDRAVEMIDAQLGNKLQLLGVEYADAR